MQITDSQKRRVALFFIGGFVLFLVIAAALVGNKLLKREKCYYSDFKDISVAGLSEGSSVKFQGMNIGSVSSITIDPQDSAIIRINFCINPNTPMKEGTVAELGNIGITGLKFLELKGGGTGSDIPLGGKIPSTESTWDVVTGKATVIATKLEQILNSINEMVKQIKPETVSEIAENIKGITKSFDILLGKNKNEINIIMKNTAEIVRKFNNTMDHITGVATNIETLTAKKGEVEKTLISFRESSDTFREAIKSADITENAKKISHLVDSVQETVDTVNLTLKRSQEDISDAMDNLAEGMDNFSEFTRMILENPSTLLRGTTGE